MCVGGGGGGGTKRERESGVDNDGRLDSKLCAGLAIAKL